MNISIPVRAPVGTVARGAPAGTDAGSADRAATGMSVFALVAGGCTAIVFLLMFAGAGQSSAPVNLLDDVALVFALVAARLAVHRTTGDERVMWIVITAGVVSWTLGEAVFDFRLLALRANPVQPLSDTLYMGFYAAMVTGLWLRDRGTRERGFEVHLIDSVVVALAISIVAWGVVYESASGPDAAAIGETGRIFYPLLEGLVIWAVAQQLYNTRVRWDASRYLLAGAMLATFASGLLFVLVGRVSSGAAMSLAMTLIGVAALAANDRPPAPRSADLPHRAHLPEAVLLLAWAGIAAIGAKHFFAVNPTLAVLIGAAMTVIVLRLVTVYAKNERLLRASERRAATDPLTGLGNRQYFHERIDAELARAQRDGGPVALLLVDIDNFKTINDLAGHRAGDRVLQQIAQKLRESVRPFDVVCRIGGDELAIIAPDAGGAAALEIGQRVCENVAEIAISEFPDVPRVSVSVGCTCFPDFGGDVTELVDTADEALYNVKNGGRGAAMLYSPYAPHPKTAEWQLERTRAELAARNADFQAVFRHAQEAMVIFNEEGSLLLVNDAATRLFHASRERMIGRKLSDFVQPDAVEQFRALLPRLLVDGHGEGTVDVMVPGARKHDSAERATVEFSTARFGPGRFLSILWDVTEERRAAEELAENERRFRAIFESSLDPIFITDDLGVIRDANAAAAELTGRALTELIGATASDLVHPSDVASVSTHLDQLRDVKARRGTFTTTDQDGAQRAVEYSSVADFVPGLHLTIVRDVTALRAARTR